MAWLHTVIDLPTELYASTAEFWQQALGWPLGDQWPGHPELRSFEPPDGAAYVHLQQVVGPPRVHVDVECADPEASIQAALDRGAEVTGRFERVAIPSAGDLGDPCTVSTRVRLDSGRRADEHRPRTGTDTGSDVDRGTLMRSVRITTNLAVRDIEAAKGFYTGFLGLATEEFNLGWVARYTDTETGAHVQLVTGDLTSPQDASISVHTDDVDAAYREAQEHGYEIVHPLTTEEWGVRRFHVRAPDGTVVNVVAHRE